MDTDEEVEQDVAAIREAIAQSERGEGRPAGEFFDELHTMLLAMKAKQQTDEAD